jgi:hypothetical protein
MDFTRGNTLHFYNPINPVLKGDIKMNDSPTMEYPPTIKWVPGIKEITHGEDAKGRPQLLLPDNQYITIHFPWGDFQELNNQWGVSYKFNVNIDSQRYTLFADKKLYEAISDYGIRENQTIQIKRTMTDFEKNGEARKYKTYDLIPPEGEQKPTSEATPIQEDSADNFIKSEEGSDDLLGGDL